ncbi:MAG: sigma-70 family RNA polymerase sigma factor [Polyangiaceae bacterium]|jgi:RNA polymerase sigma-70 factor, ECF subfamily|nr:sigma-70 family RNA polymerase sigma factor [Polyangiaceae bacterium]
MISMMQGGQACAVASEAFVFLEGDHLRALGAMCDSLREGAAPLARWAPSARTSPEMAGRGAWGRPRDGEGGRNRSVPPEEAAAQALLERGETRAALEALMLLYGEVVYAFCLRIVNDRALADDVRQLVFWRAYERLATFAGGSSLRTWLLGIAKHQSIDALRSSRRRARFLVLDGALGASRLEGVCDPGATIDSACTRSALAASLEKRLSDEERAAVLLHYRDELTYEEMSALCGEKADTLRARVARALVKLRRGV